MKIFLSCFLFTATASVNISFGQCEKWKVFDLAGHNDRFCAPVTQDLNIKYAVEKGSDVKFHVNWGNGKDTTFIPAPVDSFFIQSKFYIQYEDNASYTYKKDGDQCNYNIEVFVVIDGVLCTNSRKTTEISVWDKDDANGGKPLINPNLYRVCYGESAEVTFNDNSIWNCVPASGETDAPNNENRWNQWIYGTNPSTIPGIVVDNSITTFPHNSSVEYLPAYVISPSSKSLKVAVPNTTTAADVGRVFTVNLRNWNICNPYDVNIIDGNPLNPANPDGDSAFIETTAQIIIVDKVNPDFQTRKDNKTGLITSKFCVGDKVFFQDLTATIEDAAFLYEWKIYDDENGTVLARTSTNKNSTYTFTSKGRKKIQLTIKDNNSVGKCGGTIVKYIDIVSAADAKIQVTDENDKPLDLDDLCFNATNNSFKIKFTDVSSDFDPVNSKWQWDFYHFDGTTYVQDIYEEGEGTQQSFIQTYTDPGSYMAVLTATAKNVNCPTYDTAYVHIYQQPAANFTAPAVCRGDSTLFTSTATLPKIVNNDYIKEYEWDFDNDGIFEVTSTDTSPFNYKFEAAGMYPVTHRVTTAKGECSGLITRNVEVKPTPYVSFEADILEGCSPLTVTFSPDTLLENQPVQITSYIWHIKDLKTGNTKTITVNPPADTLVAPEFVNTQSSLIDHQYEVWLEAKAANSCGAESNKKVITVYPGPSSEFIITNLSGGDNNCAPRNYQFQVMAATQALNPNSYRWTITDEEDSSLIADISLPGSNPDFDFTLTQEGNTSKKFKVRLLAERNDMCFSATKKIVMVNPVPSSEFTVTEIETDCQSVTYHVEAQQKGLIYQWAIDPLPLNNPDLSQDQFKLVYSKKLGSSSNINIQLKTTNLAGCESVVTQENITVDPQEVIDASFLVSPSILEIPNRTVSITTNTTSENWTYLWDFGDGTSSTSPSPGTHEYKTHGEYWIKVQVAGAYCHEEDSAKVIIKQTLPVVDFDYSQIEGCLPLTVYFSNETNYADENTYLWNFGDGTTSTEMNPSYTYKTSGVYTITLQASNSLGVIVTKEKDLVIDLSQGPKADFNIRLAKSYLPDQDIVFSNQSQRATSYYWDFGDGNTSSKTNPVHQYEETGNYDVMLVVQNDLGCSDTLIKPIFIEPLVPEVDFTYEPPTGCRPLTVQYRNLSRYAEPGSYRWSFGEGQGVSTEENPTYTYYEPGVYTVTLEASNSIGVTSTEKKEFSVEVYDNPIAAFNLRPDKAFLGEDIYLVNLSLGAKYYFWEFGDGNTSTDFEPVHRYEEPGTYDITLVAENEHGCADTLKKTSAVIVEKGGKIQVPNAFTPSTFGPGGTDATIAGKNDVFLPVNEGVTSFHMMIYNRWGEILFESYDKGYGWDGYYKGKLCAKDVYVYKLELKFSDGRSDTLVGDITLIR